MPIEFYFTPELHLRDGRIRDLDDAISFAREQRLDQEPSVQGCANKETIKFFQSLRLGRRYLSSTAVTTSAVACRKRVA
jgi:hypothetical protein